MPSDDNNMSRRESQKNKINYLYCGDVFFYINRYTMLCSYSAHILFFTNVFIDAYTRKKSLWGRQY